MTAVSHLIRPLLSIVELVMVSVKTLNKLLLYLILLQYGDHIVLKDLHTEAK